MTYAYLVMNPAGKEVKGSLEAESRQEAALQLQAEGNTLISLTEANVLSKEIKLGIFQKKPKPRDMAVFCRQFVSIIDAGVPVTSALRMLGEQTENKMLAEAINGCRESIEKGSSLADAMREHRQVFSDLFITLVEAGEASGSLDVSFTRMANQFEKEAKIKGLIKKSSIYPIIVCVVAVVVVIVMLTFVVPQFESMLSDLGSDLPMLTKIVVTASHLLIKRWYVFLAVIVALVLGIRHYKHTEGGGRFFGRLGIKAPLVGKLTVKSASARMARTLSTLLGSGIPLIEALDIVSQTMGNVFFREALEDAKDDVAMGDPLSDSIERCGLFPPLVHHMIRIGEETGDIEEMLAKLAEYYEEEVELTTQQVMAAVEPLIIIVLALIVGIIVGAVMLPMMSMYSALDNL
ncbi:MAG: type II secretion system F family protein [Oscillospiraceae bacterium]